MEQFKDGRSSLSAYFAIPQEVHVCWHRGQGYDGSPSVVSAHVAEESDAELKLEGPRCVPGCLLNNVDLFLDCIQSLVSASTSVSELLKEAPVMEP
jgi:hypothetical protein